MKKLSFIFLAALFSNCLFSQDYNAKTIPENLKIDADAVIRKWDTYMQIQDLEKSVFKVSRAITILNEDGDRFAQFTEFYDELDKIKKIDITIYDAEGKLAKRVKGFEIQDINYTDAGSLYDSERVKAYFPDSFDYPYTVEIEFEKTQRSSVYYPVWNMRRSQGLSVENAQLVVETPLAFGLRYRESNYEGQVEIEKDDAKEHYRWHVSNLPALESEYRGLSVYDMSPHVILAPTNFSMEGYSGTMDNWENFGKWSYELNKGRDKLPENVISKLKSLTAGLSSDKEKIKAVYEYMQSQTRYVSIQLGIGGFQTFDAMSVANNGYGDCKALTNYTYSLLKEVGIKAFYTLVRAGDDEDDILVDFPSNQFNHVILSVPMEKDTVWLECTSQTAPFNFLGGFTADRHALMITENGGKLVKTPSYPMEENKQIREGLVTLDEEGNAKASIQTVFEGRQYDDYASVIKIGREDQRKHLLSSIDIPSFDLGEFSFDEEKTESPRITRKVELGMRKYATKTGKRFFFVPNIMNRQDVTPPKNADRKSPIIIKYAYMDVDSITFQLPEKLRLEFNPDPVNVESVFGNYNVTYSFDEATNQVTYVRTIKMHKGRFPASSYDDYRNFRRDIARADKSKLVLIGGT